MPARPVIIDCDPGCDHVAALCLAFAAPEALDILGITAVAGNVELVRTQRNARIVRELAGRTEVPVFAGFPRPLVRPLVTAPAVHGEEGIGDMEIYQPAKPLERRHAVDFIIERLRAAADDTITLVALGPLTNLAVAMIQDPAILPKVREIVQLGSARREGGNVTPAANFNIVTDPHAAAVVYGCGRPITAIGLDVTNRVESTPERLAAIAAIDTPAARAVHAAVVAYDRNRAAIYNDPSRPLGLAGPCAIAYLLHPELFGGRRANVAVKTGSTLTLGMTIVDYWGVTDRAPNAQWLDTVDADGVYALLTDRLTRLPR